MLDEIIYKRKSCRRYNKEELTNEEIDNLKEFISKTKSLDESIKTDYDILKGDEISTIQKWRAPYYLAIYSENKPYYKTNIGFIYQQVDLYLQSQGIGSCWVGLGKAKKPRENMEHVILMAFGKSDKSIYRAHDEFKRKSLEKISKYSDERLEVARIAPSAVNNQPWYFKKNNDGYEVYCIKHNFLKAKTVGKWNPVDMGIALAHLYVSNPKTFDFTFNNQKDEIKGYNYLGRLTI